MIKTIIFDVSENNNKKQLATLDFNGCGLPQRGDNIVIDDTIYVVQRKEYITDKRIEGTSTHSYIVGLQVKKYIPEMYGF